MRKTIVAAVACVVALVLLSDRRIVRAQGGGAWTFVAPMLAAHGGNGAALSPDGRIVVVDDQGVETYDVASNAWAPAASMLTPRFNLGAVAAGGDAKIYAMGGEDASGVRVTAEAYDAASDTWSAVADMPTARASAGVVAGADGRIYVIGGRSIDGEPLDVVEAYDPASGLWSTLAPMPTPRFELSAALALDGRIYAVAGRDFADVFGTVEAYDPTTNRWTTMAPLPVAVRAPAAATAPNGWVVVTGGIQADRIDADATATALDPATNIWTHLPRMATLRHTHAAVTGADGRVYALGGAPAIDGSQTAAVEVFTFPAHTVRLYLHGTDLPATAGGFTMSSAPPSTTPAPIALLNTTRWFSDRPLMGSFGASARVRFVKPCNLGLTLSATYTLAATDAAGASPRILGQTSRPFSLCLASETIAIPMATPASLSGERLAFAITTMAGTNLTLTSGAGMYLEATDFTGVP